MFIYTYIYIYYNSTFHVKLTLSCLFGLNLKFSPISPARCGRQSASPDFFGGVGAESGGSVHVFLRGVEAESVAWWLTPPPRFVVVWSRIAALC